MNLIEQLGGYEAAKTKRDQINSTLENSELLGGGDAKEGLYDRLESIEQALLQYRRQHNIFEAEDKVVFTDILNSCVVTFESTETDPMQIVWLTYPDGTAGYVFHLNKIKHATDEEIRAGKRLEVK
ncbi:hypothetical protein [Acinetobacter johnsonii]|uniref:hypothetical protein n=1 Tax=Acinetobacter johnsonii TaxID=40214 RepID=UPI00244888F6|nr:hypothetical protein [Acinetobacter johnsonii]MDH1800055.1 hypothetical protein [Acinetobacter johnsonii]